MQLLMGEYYVPVIPSMITDAFGNIEGYSSS